MATQLEDGSPMPMGKHRGKRMQDVPASYLLWLADEADHCPADIAQYVEANRKVLEWEVERKAKGREI